MGIFDKFKDARELSRKIELYEESYRQSKVKHPDYPDLEDSELSKLKWSDREAYVKRLDEIAHMKDSIDAAYNSAKESKSYGHDPVSAYLDGACDVHDAWCKNKRGSFGERNRAGQAWQYLSMQAIGWEEVRKDMKYVSIALEAEGYPPFSDVEDAVKAKYEDIRATYLTLTPEKRRAFEANRWIDLSKEIVRDTPSDKLNTNAAYLAGALPDYEDELEDKWIEDGDVDESYIVGSPYHFPTFHESTFIEKNDSYIDSVIALADEHCGIKVQKDVQDEKKTTRELPFNDEIVEETPDDDYGLGGA